MVPSGCAVMFLPNRQPGENEPGLSRRPILQTLSITHFAEVFTLNGLLYTLSVLSNQAWSGRSGRAAGTGQK